MKLSTLLTLLLAYFALGCGGGPAADGPARGGAPLQQNPNPAVGQLLPASGNTVRPVVDIPEGWRRKLEGITIGVEREQAEVILSRVRTAKSPVIASGFDDTSQAIYHLNNQWEAAVVYSKGRLVSIQVRPARKCGWADFAKLKPEIPPSLYESVVLIHKSPSLHPSAFNPTALIRTVNHLRERGIRHSVEALTTYYNLVINSDADRSFDYNLDEERVFLILVLLFQPKNREPLVPRLGMTGLRRLNAPDDREWPTFPIICIADIPFLLPHRDEKLTLRAAPNLSLGLEYCKATCNLRPAPLFPSLPPHEAVESLLKEKKLERLFRGPNAEVVGGPVVGLLRTQALHAVSELYPVTSEELQLVSPSSARSTSDADESWNRRVAALTALRLEWDPMRSSFRKWDGKRDTDR